MFRLVAVDLAVFVALDVVTLRQPVVESGYGGGFAETLHADLVVAPDPLIAGRRIAAQVVEREEIRCPHGDSIVECRRRVVDGDGPFYIGRGFPGDFPATLDIRVDTLIGLVPDEEDATIEDAQFFVVVADLFHQLGKEFLELRIGRFDVLAQQLPYPQIERPAVGTDLEKGILKNREFVFVEVLVDHPVESAPVDEELFVLRPG